ncbi:breast cancer metastasis-suppressor 1 isoform X2 [Tachyglossus aculeatus]|uniref:breast cancer metastasis-suppressor 1 isoform X2 n=1 Tax=Tachyglossus aculeatus TaxID=9261 RepID=UPI0018F41E0A|nr:breast cancer metastasis-suppressor 1 isoform X2 [Tachyglossus aculeatus]
MPVQPLNKEAEEMEVEGDSAAEMNGEEEESEEEQSGSQSESEEESSEMDDEDCERRRSECLDEMSDLEKQFSELKEKLFKERLSQVRVRLEEVGAERAPEYTEPLGGLQRSLKIRIQVAGIYKGFCLDVIRNKYECELQGAKQHLESEKLLLYDNLQGELQERIQRLEEDRQSFDINSGNLKAWDSLQSSKRKKAPLVSGPYIVYMLQDIDILEDWTAIKKAKAAVSPQKRKSDGYGSGPAQGGQGKRPVFLWAPRAVTPSLAPPTPPSAAAAGGGGGGGGGGGPRRCTAGPKSEPGLTSSGGHGGPARV